MSDGRTYWWALDAAWFRRERQAAIALEHGPTGLAALLWLCCHAKELNDEGRLKSGYNAVAMGIGASPGDVVDAIKTAVDIGALDDFEEDGTMFTCRISGWSADQGRGAAALRKSRQRTRERDEA